MDDQIFKFREQRKAILFIDGNYLIDISKRLSIKLDMEKLFNEFSKGMYLLRTYWFSAIESSLDRANNTYRFLDRLRYIPRTQVFAGKLTKRQDNQNSDSALKTDAGINLAVSMVEKAINKEADTIILVAGDPEYIPAIRVAQRYGVIVKVVAAKYLGDLRIHSDLQKVADEIDLLETEMLQKFEYIPSFDFDVDYEVEEEETITDEMIDEVEEEEKEHDIIVSQEYSDKDPDESEFDIEEY